MSTINDRIVNSETGSNDQYEQNRIPSQSYRAGDGYLRRTPHSGRVEGDDVHNIRQSRTNIKQFLTHLKDVRRKHDEGKATLDPIDANYMLLYKVLSSRGKKNNILNRYLDKMMDACCEYDEFSETDSESYNTTPQMFNPTVSMKDDQFERIMNLAERIMGTFEGETDKPSKVDKLMDMMEKVASVSSSEGVNKATEVMDSIKGVTDPIGGIFKTLSSMFSLGSVGANTAAFAGIALLISFAKSYDSWKTEYVVIKILVALYCLFLCWKYKDQMYKGLKNSVQQLVELVTGLFSMIKEDDDVEETDLTMESIHTTAQGFGVDLGALDVGVDILLAGLGLSAIVDPKEKASFLTTVSKTVGTRQSLTDYVRSIVSILTKLVNKISSKIFNTEGILLLKSGEVAIDSILARIAEMLNQANSGKLHFTTTNLEKIQSLYCEAASVYKVTPVNRFTSNGVNLLRTSMNELNILIKEFQHSNLGLAGYRMDPVWINFSGKPAIQKTLIVNTSAAFAVKQHCSNEEWEAFKKDPDMFICNRISENGHWEGYYENAIAVIWDDFLQKRSFLGDTCDAALEMIRAKNTFAFPLHFAGMENKGRRFFRSPFIFTTTNRDTFQVETIVSQEALLRRIDIDLTVTIKPEFCKDPNKMGVYERDLDLSKLENYDDLAKEIDFGVFEFHRKVNGVYTDVLDYDQVLQLIKHTYAQHKSFLNANKVLFAKMYEKIETSGSVLVEDLNGNKTSTKFDHDFPFRDMEIDSFQTRKKTKRFPFDEFRAVAQMAPDRESWTEADMFREFNPDRDNNFEMELTARRNRQRLDDYERSLRSSISSSTLPVLARPPSVATSYATADSMTSYTEEEVRSQLKELGLNPDIIKKVKIASPREFENYFPEKFLDKWSRFLTWQLHDYVKLREILIPYVSGSLAWYTGKPEFFCAAFAHHSEENFALMVSICMGVNPDHLNIPYCDIEMPVYKSSRTFKIPCLGVVWSALIAAYEFIKFKGKEFLKNIESSDVIILLGSIPTCYLIYKFFFAKRKMRISPQSGATASRGNTKPVVKSKTVKELKARFASAKPQGRDLNGDDIANNIYKHNVWSIRYSPNGDSFLHAGYLVGLKGRIAILPKHFIASWTHESKKDIFYPEIELRLFCGDIHKASIKMGEMMECVYDINVDNCDLAFVKFPKGFPMFKDISDKFVAERDLSLLTNSFTSMMSSPHRQTSIISTNSVANKINVIYNVHEEEYFLTRTIKYQGLTEEGDCGAPLIARVERLGSRRILGIHVSALDLEGIGFCTIVTQEIIALCTDLIQETSDTTIFTTPQNMEIAIERTFEVMGGDPEGRVNNTGNWSEIRKSPLHSHHEYNIPLTAPALLRTIMRNEVEINPYHVMLEKYKCEPVVVDRDTLLRSVEDLESFLLKQSTKNHDFRLLTLEEVCYGIPGSSIKSMNASSSVGFPLKITHPNLKKDLFYKYPRDENNPGLPILQKLIDDIVDKFLANERPLILFTDNLKDERRSKEKVASGASRGFNGAPLDFCALFKMFFGTFIEWLTDNKIVNGCAVGVNAYSKEWHQIYNFLYERNPEGGDGDYKGYDGSLLAVVINEICEMIIRIIGDTDEINNKIRRQLFDEIMFARHIYWDVIYEQHSGNPSGNPFTTFLNCLYNLVAFRYCFYKNKKFWYERFYDHVTLFVLGDDNIWSISPVIVEDFNQLTLSEDMISLGLRYTTAQKGTAVFKTRPIKDLEFLKRSFRYSESRGLWIAPLRLDVALEICQWSKKTMYLTIFYSNVAETLKELSLHGEDVFETYRRRIKDFFIRGGRDFDEIPELTDSYRFVRDRVLNSHFIL